MSELGDVIVKTQTAVIIDLRAKLAEAQAENARLREKLQSWEEGSEPAIQDLKRERDEAVRQLGDAIWYEEDIRAERDRYKALAERRGEALLNRMKDSLTDDGEYECDPKCNTWVDSDYDCTCGVVEAHAALAATAHDEMVVD